MTTLWAAEAGLYVGIDNRGNIVTSVSSHCVRIKILNLFSPNSSQVFTRLKYPRYIRVTRYLRQNGKNGGNIKSYGNKSKNVINTVRTFCKVSFPYIIEYKFRKFSVISWKRRLHAIALFFSDSREWTNLLVLCFSFRLISLIGDNVLKRYLNRASYYFSGCQDPGLHTPREPGHGIFQQLL